MKQTPRSNRRDVRNPMLKLPEICEEWERLPADSRAALIRMLRAVSAAARRQGHAHWDKHKPTSAAYWMAKAIDARHLALSGKVAGTAA